MTTEYDDEFALKPVSAIISPLFKVSNKGTQYVDYSEQRKIQMRNQIQFCKQRIASGQLE